VLLGWLHGAASLYALAYSLCEAWGLVRAARRAEPKRRNPYEWAARDPKWKDDDARVGLRIEAAEHAYSWKPGMLLTEQQWLGVKTTCSILKAELSRDRKKKKAAVVKIDGHCYPLNELGMKAAVRDGVELHPYEVFGHFQRAQTRREIADLIEKNPKVGDWDDPAWKS